MGTNRGHRRIKRLCQCYISVWAPREDELFVAGIRTSRWTSEQQQNFGTSWKPHFSANETLPLIGICFSLPNSRKQSLSSTSSANRRNYPRIVNSEAKRTLWLETSLLQTCLEIQRELKRETLEPAQALRLAINMELGQRNQLQTTNSQPASHVNTVTSQRSFPQLNQRPTTSSFTRPSNQLCRNCGLIWSANHRDKCIARGKTCNNCGLQNHFSRVCRKPKSSSNKPTRSIVNSVEDTPTDQTLNAIQNMDYNPPCESDYDSSDDNIVASIAINSIQIEPKNTTLHIGNTQVGLLIDSGSVCSILTESLATEIVDNSPLARWLMTTPLRNSKHSQMNP